MEAENGTFKKGKACCDSNTKTDDSCEEHERHLEKPKETGKGSVFSPPILRDESKETKKLVVS